MPEMSSEVRNKVVATVAQTVKDLSTDEIAQLIGPGDGGAGLLDNNNNNNNNREQ